MRYIVFSLFLVFLPLFSAQAAEDIHAPANKLRGDAREYYQRIWNQTFDRVKAGEIYHWDAKLASGDIRVGEEYISKSKATCRNFSESFIVGSEKGSNQGVACKRDEGKGWCKLSSSAVHTCALDERDGFTDKIIDKAASLWD